MRLIQPKSIHRPIAILGGSAGLPDEIDELLKKQPDLYLIAVNQHAHQLPLTIDLTVYRDAHTRKLIPEGAETLGQIGDGPTYPVETRWDIFHSFSAHTALAAACYMGTDNIYLCGFDCYRTRYFYDLPAAPMGCRFPEEKHVKRWRLVRDKIASNPELYGPISRIHAMSPPLDEVFP